MSTAEAVRPTDATPGSRRNAIARRWAPRLGLAAGVVLLTVLTVVATGTSVPTGALDPDSPAPTGAGAVVEVLRGEGVEVTRADDLGTALAARGTTVLVDDRGSILSAEQYERLARGGARIVLLQPDDTALRALAPGIALAGTPASTDEVTADCAFGPALRAGRLEAGGQTYRLLEGPGEVCFPTGDGAAALVRVPGPGGAGGVTVVGDPALFRNDSVAEGGRAALALGLLGGTDRLTWYLPSVADAAGGARPTAAELAPGWVTPVVLLLLAAGLATAVHRGRRFGPLVVEALPALVRAGETAEGRARLYARSSARTRALDALRIGTLGRLSRDLALPRSADPDSVADAVAQRLGRDRSAVRGLLLLEEPATDRDLVALSDGLLRLEEAVRLALGDPGAAGHDTRPAAATGAPGPADPLRGADRIHPHERSTEDDER